MSERVSEGGETRVATKATPRVLKRLDSRRARLLGLLRTQAGRQQALLLADIVSAPMAIRRRRIAMMP